MEFNKNENLDTPIYNKHKISDLLEIIEKGKEKKSKDKSEDNLYKYGIPILVAQKYNNGVGGLVQPENTVKIFNNKFCIVNGGDGGGGKTYFFDFEFCATSFITVCDISEKYIKDFDIYSKLYRSIVISERIFRLYGHGRNMKKLSDIDIELPVKNNKIDTEYMTKYIKI